MLRTPTKFYSVSEWVSEPGVSDTMCHFRSHESEVLKKRYQFSASPWSRDPSREISENVEMVKQQVIQEASADAVVRFHKYLEKKSTLHAHEELTVSSLYSLEHWLFSLTREDRANTSLLLCPIETCRQLEYEWKTSDYSCGFVPNQWESDLSAFNGILNFHGFIQGTAFRFLRPEFVIAHAGFSGTVIVASMNTRLNGFHEDAAQNSFLIGATDEHILRIIKP
jgi:hypothetical protein